ncbi:MAG: acyltransferase [Gammaproteobacteria bacterium]|nr:acyltransferase [Gammaproteobacteria bacterium]
MSAETASPSPEFSVEGVLELRRVCAEITAQANRTIDLLSNELDAMLYDQKPFLESIKQLALRSHQSRIRILLRDNSRAQREGHRLVELARQLPSNIEIRRPAEAHCQQSDELLIADGSGYFRRDERNRTLGFASYRNRLQAEQLGRRFEEIWQQGSNDSDLRRLHL